MRFLRSALMLAFAFLFCILVFLTIAAWVTSRRWERDMSQALRDQGIRAQITISIPERNFTLHSPVWSIETSVDGTSGPGPRRVMKADSLVFSIPIRELPALLVAPESLRLPMIEARAERVIIQWEPLLPEIFVTTLDLRLHGAFTLDPATWQPARFLGETERIEAVLNHASLREGQIFEQARLSAERADPDAPEFHGTLSGSVDRGRVIPTARIVSMLESRRPGVLPLLPTEGIPFTRLEFLITTNADGIRLVRGTFEGPQLDAGAHGAVHPDRSNGGFPGYRGEVTLNRIASDLRPAATAFTYMLTGRTIATGADGFTLRVEGDRMTRPRFTLEP